jgi:hypothetical protein
MRIDILKFADGLYVALIHYTFVAIYLRKYKKDIHIDDEDFQTAFKKKKHCKDYNVEYIVKGMIK